jgi:hypothetical protein
MGTTAEPGYEILNDNVVDFLKFVFGHRPLLKTDIICKDCKGYVSLKFDAGSNGKSGWVTRRCLCGTDIKYLKSGNLVKIAKKDYDPIYKRWKRESVVGGN